MRNLVYRASLALGMAFLTLLGGAHTAAGATDPALIDPAAPVSLHITKYLGAPKQLANDGRDLGNGAVDLPTLGGVEFDVYRVYTDPARTSPLDLTTNAGWDTASAATNYRPTAADLAARQFTSGATTHYLGNPTEVTTAADGTATFTSPAGAGLYLVAESVEADDALTASSGESVTPTELTPAAPFLVTLPMTDPQTRDRWMYDVHVYPKNQQQTMTKTVSDRGTVTQESADTYGAAAEHAYEYTLTSSITDGSNSLGSYVIYDDLDPSLTFTGAAVRLSGGTTLTAGTHYQVYTATDWGASATPYSGGEISSGPLVTVVLTDAGRTLLEANRAQQVVTTLRVIAGPRDTDGIVPNRASFVPDAGWWSQNGTPGVDPNTPTAGLPPGETGIRTSDPVETRFGDLVIDKHETGTNNKLAGAVFAVHASTNRACAVNDISANTLITTTAPTDELGETRATGLQTSDYYNGATQTDLITYCLVETKAPVGYELDAQPRPFTIALADTTVSVPNTQANLANKLPLTGGPGILLLSAIGILLILAGVTYYVASARRTR